MEKLPPEIRYQIWEGLAEEVPLFGHSWSSFGYFPIGDRESRKRAASTTYRRGILTASRKISREISPLFYRKVCIIVAHPNQTLHWLQTISPRNSACIRHLVIRYHSLLLDYNDKQYGEDRISAWSAALQCMPALVTLTFDFNDRDTKSRKATPDKYIIANDTIILSELAKSALAWLELRNFYDRSSLASFQYRPQRAPPGPCEGRQQRFNHALIAIDEDVPWPLQRFFAKRLDTHYTSLDLPVTGLPPEFFPQAGYELMNTYAFNEDKTEQVSVTLTYQKLPRRSIRATLDDLEFVMSGLPIKYLRLGCRHFDSRCLDLISTLANQTITLDLSFTDPDPEQVVKYLDQARLRCPALYTVAIAVSPLHDRDPNDPEHEDFFNRKAVGKEVAARWKPFWDKIDEMVASGVKVWEGEVRSVFLNWDTMPI